MKNARPYFAHTAPPKEWDETCENHNSLFHSTAWQEILSSSFKTRTIYLWDAKEKNGLALPVFNAGPFRIGYAGFPLAGTIQKNGLTNNEAEMIQHTKYPKSIHLLRLPLSSFSLTPDFDFPYQETWETSIENLQQWQFKNLPSSVKQDIRKAEKSSVNIDQSKKNHYKNMYQLYYETIIRHKGNIRYSEKYFEQIVELSQTRPNLHSLSALLDGKVISFIIVAIEKKTAYYLHGATDMVYQRYRSSDLLLSQAILWAKNMGASSFNMMASPLDQPGLVWYKEKWGGKSKIQKTYTMPLQQTSASVFTLANKIYHQWSTIHRNFQGFFAKK